MPSPQPQFLFIKEEPCNEEALVSGLCSATHHIRVRGFQVLESQVVVAHCKNILASLRWFFLILHTQSN